MAVSERRARHRASLRREILDAASQLFVEEGYQHVTMRRIAGRIEYSPTTIYLYFKDKNELLAAVCDETFSQLATKLERLGKTATSPLAYLREGLRTYVEFGLAHPHQYAVTFMSPGARPENTGHEHPVGSRWFDTLRGGLEACVLNGDLHAPNLDTTSQVLWAAMHGITSLLIAMEGFPFVDRRVLVDCAIDTLVAGLRPRGPSATAAAKAARLTFLD